VPARLEPGRFEPGRFKPSRFKPSRFKQGRSQLVGIGDVDLLGGRHHRHAPDQIDGEADLTHLHHLRWPRPDRTIRIGAEADTCQEKREKNLMCIYSR
jgi:hypothetical protein